MTQRFQIDDLVAQDESSVVFRAIDTESQTVVAVQRFIPYGADGPGFNDEQKSAFELLVSRLTVTKHDGLRTVVSGGCDRVDGMPYLATEWISGPSLKSYIGVNPLPPEEAVKVLMEVLDLCELLSNVLGEEHVWLETDVESILVKEGGEGSIPTFWISPLKWLGRPSDGTGLGPIIVLTEQLLERSEKNVESPVGRGLQMWFNWLQKSGKSATLKEARDALRANITATRPKPSKKIVQQSTRQVTPATPTHPQTKKRMNKWLVASGILIFVATWLGGWAAYRKGMFRPRSHQPSMVELAAQTEAAYLAKNVSPASETRVKEATTVPVLTPDDPKLPSQIGKITSIQGTLRKISHSGRTGKTLFLYFSDPPATTQACGAILLSAVGKDLQQAALTRLIGKKIQITGKLKASSARTLRGPEIPITKRDAIIELP